MPFPPSVRVVAAGRGAAGAMAAAGPLALVTSCARGFAAQELVRREWDPAATAHGLGRE